MEQTVKTDSNKINSLKSLILFLIPGFYFFRSRLKGIEPLIFHGWYEWLAGVIILILLQEVSLTTAVTDYITGFLSFISLYEIGYIVNDYYSVKKEVNPRKRVEGFEENEEWSIALMILARIGFFVIFTYLGEIYSLNFLFISLLMVGAFALHNFVQVKEIKFITFVSLALLRFLLPLIPFIHVRQLQVLVPVVLINYVLYRLINYLASKDVLIIAQRKEPSFKLMYYLLLIPVNLFLMVVYESSLPLILNVYYLIFWIIYWFRGRYSF